jgi:outer membrane protein assembly factor BamB
MGNPPSNPVDQPPPHQETNPLGGRVHLTGSAEPVQRHWSGYVALVRRCPHCGWENEERTLFCVSCAEDIRSVEPVSSSDSRPGVAMIHKRLQRERRMHLRSRAANSTGGGGWIAFGALLVVIALVIGSDRTISALFWIVAVSSALAGIWQIRTDPKAMRMWGTVLAGCAALLILFVGFRAIQATEAFSDRNPGEAVATPTSIMQSTVQSGTPQNVIAGSVPMYRGGPTHNGQMPGPAPEVAPTLAWQMDTGGEVYGAPALADGVLYLTSKSGTIHAIDASSGKSIWQREITSYVTRASPAVVDGVVYVSGGFALSALDAATGKELWTVPLQYGGQASPTVLNGTLIVSSQQGWIYALKTSSGELAWRIPTEGIAFGAAAVTENEVVYGTDEGILYSVNPKTGTLNWRTNVPGAIYASPVVSGDVIHVTTQSGELIAFDLATGTEIWSVDHGSAEPPAVGDGILVLAANDGGVYGLDPATGEQKWLYPSGKQSLSAPAIAGNLAIFGADNSLLAIDITTGEAAWYFLAGDNIESSPVIAEGYVFFGSSDGFLNAVTDR